MKLIASLNVVTKEFLILEHNVSDEDAPELISAYIKFGFQAVSFMQLYRHFSIGGPEVCHKCNLIVRDKLNTLTAATHDDQI